MRWRNVLTVFNKREIMITRDLSVRNKIGNLLSAQKIEYCVKTNNITNVGRNHGVPFINPDFSFEYRINVKKKDFQEALKIIG